MMKIVHMGFYKINIGIDKGKYTIGIRGDVNIKKLQPLYSAASCSMLMCPFWMLKHFGCSQWLGILMSPFSKGIICIILGWEGLARLY